MAIRLLMLGLALALAEPAFAQTAPATSAPPSSAPPVTDPGPVRAGDRWSYDIRDDVTGDQRQPITVVVTGVDDKEITTRLSVRGRDRPQVIVFNPAWGRIDDGVWKFRPSDIGVHGSMKVGAEWRSEASASNLKSGTVLRGSGVAKVTAEEKITTPAGLFETFRVDMTVRQINTNDQTKSSTSTIVVWYAPAVNRWVRKKTEIRFEGRLRDSWSEELTDYSRKQ